MMSPDWRTPRRAGVGLRLAHLAEVAASRPTAAWLEIHPENFLANPHASELLIDIARDVPISVHTVGVSVGSANGIDWAHLARVRALIERIDPVLVSGHLAWSTHAGEYLNDLLPLPYDGGTLALVARHVEQVQDFIGRRYLVENPSSYLGFAGSTMTEPQFLAELADRTGCGLLCDVSNIYLSGHNMGFDPYRYLDALPAAAIGEFHLGGFTAEADDSIPGSELLIDTHSERIAPPAWRLYRRAVRRLGPKPTMIEWDSELPRFATLLAEAATADAVAGEALARRLGMPSLSDLQAQVRDAVVGFPVDDTGDLAALLTGGRDPRKRLAIHRRHYEASLVAALLEKFPAVTWLIGAPFVTELARAFVHRHPPRAPCIAEYGAAFGEFIDGTAGVELPYLRAFAELEWYLGRAAIAISLPPLAISAFAKHAEPLADLRLMLQPGLHYLAAAWPIDDLVKVYLDDSKPDCFAFEPLPVHLEIRGARGEFQIVRREAAEFCFRRNLVRGRPVGAASEAALEVDEAFDPGRALAALVADGLVSGITFADGEAT